MAGLLKHSPHFNTTSKFLNKKEAKPILRKLIGLSALPLKEVETAFAVDSTGFRTTQFNDYCREKHGIRKQHEWVKCHICTGVKTNIITSVQLTEENAADCRQFEPLLKATAGNGFHLQEVMADKAYSSRKNLELVVKAGALPYIPFKKSVTGKARGSRVWAQMYNYALLYAEEFNQHYHKRSNAETVFHMIKTKFNNDLKCKTFTGQTNEILFKILCHNICVLIQEMHELGIEVNYKEKEQLFQKIMV